ncbi:MAG: AbrB/MazE/SpoVT family DNA-binding domain-containing protein [Oscillospiraceae bacterium]|nr:AbrB/MazE/SpoVT family DNA-binding domain-containing protein [Oscillospiraceae bacterium]
MQTSIVKWGNSQGIRLPRALLERAHLRPNDVVDIIVEDDSLIIKKAVVRNGHKTLRERLDGFAGAYMGEEWDIGMSVGEEVL